MIINRSAATLIAAHNVLKTGVHGVAGGYIAKSTNADQLIRNADVASNAAIVTTKVSSGRFAKNQLAVGNATMLIGKGLTTDPVEVALANVFPAKLTVALFQTYPATGTLVNYVATLNDGVIDSIAAGDALEQYAEIELTALLRITQFRFYGQATSTGDGRWKISYLNVFGNWVDWVTGIVNRGTTDWSDWDSSGGEIIAIKVRITVTLLDASGYNRCLQLEVKY